MGTVVHMTDSRRTGAIPSNELTWELCREAQMAPLHMNCAHAVTREARRACPITPDHLRPRDA